VAAVYWWTARANSQFACVDGPEFDAHQVDFKVLVQRNSTYRKQEQQSLAEFRQRSEIAAAGGEEDRVCAVEAVTP